MTDLDSFLDRIRASLLARVLLVYVAASWVVLEVVSTFREEFGLPTWFFPVAVGLLLIGLPIILATAIVQESLRRRENHVPLPDFDLAEDVAGAEGAAGGPGSARAGSDADPPNYPLSRWLTWKRSIAGGVLAFTALGILGGVIVLRGTARVTEAYGAAEDAFAERAWIVVADFEAPADEPDLADAVREALTLDLQQSKYVNVYTRAQIAGVLRRMELPDTATVDPDLGRQIAEREGLAAVLAGTVSKLGDSYVLGARVLSPESGQELIVVRSTAARDQLVNAVQSLSREIRSRLGESRAAIGASEPLPRVTTRSLEALKRYAQAKEALETGEQERAADLAESAIELDPEFAMAYRLAGVAHGNLGRWAERDRYTTRAYELRDKLTERERLHVEAFYLFTQVEPVEAAAKWELILSTYPDDSRAANNLAVAASDIGDDDRAYRAARRSIELDPYVWQAYSMAIDKARALGQSSVAESLAHVAMEHGLTERATRWLWEQALAEGDWTRADAVCDSLLDASSPRGEYRAGDAAECGTLDIARGRIDRAIERLRQAREIRSERGQHFGYYWTTRMLAHAELLRGRPDRARAPFREALARHPPDSIPKPDWHGVMYWTSTTEAALGEIAAARRYANAYSADSSIDWATAAWSLRAQTAVALAADEYEAALEYDQRAVRRHFGHTVMWDQLYRARAFDGLQQADSAAALYEDVIAPHRIADNSNARAYLPVIHRRLGELYAELGDPAAAARHYEAFVELWENADPELRPQVESARHALARLAEERSAAAPGTR